jgi:hypothetical protein
MAKTLLAGRFSEEQSTLQAVRAARHSGFRIYDVFTPYPIHELDKVMGIRRSRLPWVTLAAGTLGLVLAISLQFYAAILDWPMNVGGKPDNSTLAFVPITFEMTVLLAGLTTVAALLVRVCLTPSARYASSIEPATEDSFVVVLRADFSNDLARRVLNDTGATEIYDGGVSK